MIRNIIFDWSGTLVDDLPAVWKASNFVLTQAGQPAMSLDKFRAEFRLPFTTFYDEHTPGVPMPQLEGWFHESFRREQHSVCALPHAQEFLEFCRAQKLRTFLLSTVHPDYWAIQSSVTGFAPFIDTPYVGVWDKRQRIHDILTENGLKPDETLFIGDMEHDIDTARHGGIHSVAVLTGYNTLEQLRRAEPDLIVEHLRELREIFQQNGMCLRPPVKQFEDGHPPVVTVGGLIFNDAGEVLMVRTHKWSNMWGIPGGKTKRGETSEDALRRELKEETNLGITDIKFVLVQDCIHSKEFYRDAHFVLLNYTCRARGGTDVKLNHGAQEFRWLQMADALKLPLNKPTRVLVEAVKSLQVAG
jgi:phosphoglycolate phosphatase